MEMWAYLWQRCNPLGKFSRNDSRFQRSQADTLDSFDLMYGTDKGKQCLFFLLRKIYAVGT